MWPFKSKYDKLKREDVVDAICKLEREAGMIEESIMTAQNKIDDFTKKGKAETSRDVRLFYAKKINSIKAERAQNIQRATYLMYNIQLLEKLKRAIDDNQFFKNTSKISLGSLLGDQKGLAQFLNKTLNTRINAEQVLTDADETFKEIEETYEPNQAIYGIQEQDDALLAMFETEEMLNDEEQLMGTDAKNAVNSTDSKE